LQAADASPFASLEHGNHSTLQYQIGTAKLSG
jgi:hypothetical protein